MTYRPYTIDMRLPHQPDGAPGAPRAIEGVRLLQELEAVASQLSVEIRHEDLEGSRGGLFRLRGQTCILLDRELSLPERVDLMARALARLPLDDVFLRPAVREYLEERTT